MSRNVAVSGKKGKAPTPAVSVNGIETKLDTLHTDLGTIDGRVDGLESLVTSTNSKLDTLHTDVGTTLHADVDGLEALITSTNSKLDDIITALGTANSHLAAIEANTDRIP